MAVVEIDPFLSDMFVGYLIALGLLFLLGYLDAPCLFLESSAD